MTQRVALVTGAMGGLGTAICQELAKAGHKVVAAYHPQFDNKDEWLKEQAAAGFKDFVCVAGDVSVLEDCQKMVADAEAACGQVDILINNAGITRDNLLMRMKDDEWNEIIDTNLTSLYRLSKPVLRAMMKKRNGRIISIGSVVGTMGNAGQVNYAAAKAGLVGFTKSLAREVASRGITVNAVAPGFIETDMTKALNEEQRAGIMNQVPAARLGDPKEIAAAVVFLASDDAAYITGETLHVNGGMYMV